MDDGHTHSIASRFLSKSLNNSQMVVFLEIYVSKFHVGIGICIFHKLVEYDQLSFCAVPFDLLLFLLFKKVINYLSLIEKNTCVL